MSAVTDSETVIAHDHQRPGVSNLLEIYGVLAGRAPQDLAAEFEGKGRGDLKLHQLMLSKPWLPFVINLMNLWRISTLENALKSGAEAAQVRAWKVLLKVKRKVGLLSLCQKDKGYYYQSQRKLMSNTWKDISYDLL